MSFGLSQSNGNEVISKEEIETNFCDLHTPFNSLKAKEEASRCLYCYDAPCINACPTSIDIPTFIHQIRTDNIKGSALTILSENIMGGTCARVCPTEILCEEACVLNKSVEQPVNIGSLQRFSVDSFIASSRSHPFERKQQSGKNIAVIGAGPAGLSCAHRTSMLGHDVTVFEAKDKAGGLNEFGLAAYKMVDDFAQTEIEFLLELGGIKVEYGKVLNKDISLADLHNKFDAIFIGIGLKIGNKLGIEGEQNQGVINAIEFIENIRQSSDKSKIDVDKDVVVIGAGNTAIDAAIQAKRLGAANVTLVYRRDENAMSATRWEIDLARRNQVKMIFCAAPEMYDEVNRKMVFRKTGKKGGKLIYSDKTFEISAGMVLSAIGQQLDRSILIRPSLIEDQAEVMLELSGGKILISTTYETSVKGIFAGGDCVKGDDLTVQAVQDGKLAAHAIDRYLAKEGE